MDSPAAGFDFYHFVETMFGAGTVLLVYMLTVRRADRQERDKMHLENRAFMMDLKQGQKDIETTMEILPLHGHTEADGPLHSHGIYRPKR